MARIVALVMAGSEAGGGIDALAAEGHDVIVVEPRFPDCRAELERARADLIVVDGSHAPSHGRATAGWLASKLRTVPVLFLDVPDKDVSRVKKEVPRAQFASWASLVATAQRLVDGS